MFVSLRAAMAAQNIDAYIIPSADPHQSEYVAAHWKARERLSGFTGSAGTLVVTANHAGLWTDSRYFLQAEMELAGSEVQLHKQVIPHAPEHIDWLAQNLPPASRVGLDGRLFTIGQVRHMESRFAPYGHQVVAHLDLVGPIWSDRPPMPEKHVFQHDAAFAGRTRFEKIAAVRQRMQELHVSRYLVTTLDDIAWVLNLRGEDVDCNPLFYAYLLVEQDLCHLFINAIKLPDPIRAALDLDGVRVHPYDYLEVHLRLEPASEVLLFDPATTHFRLYETIKPLNCKEGPHIIKHLKAIKNETEIRHLRRAMVKDGIALVRTFRWLEQTLTQRPVPEAEVAQKLIENRHAQGDYYGESFDAIVGYRSNGAIIHYTPKQGDCAEILPEGILLIDSGGQYLDGTTDITRTLALSEPTPEQKLAYTLVLKGHIALAQAHFPKGTTGVQLDTFARMALWQRHLNYGHGTGHGVGFFLNVHEPPQGITPNPSNERGATVFEPGMLTSNEPGYYLDGEFGMRIENLILCVEAGDGFLKFETVSLFPIDLRPVDFSLLTDSEKQWLADYHKQVWEALSPELAGEDLQWLANVQ